MIKKIYIIHFYKVSKSKIKNEKSVKINAVCGYHMKKESL
ncbi:hypothetical protein GCM10011538_20640 [Ligilactobacillus murinus]